MSLVTTPEQPSARRLRRSRALRRLFLSLLLLVLLGGLVQILGERRDVVEVAGGGYAVEVDHATRSRAGLSADLLVHVSSEGGFDNPVTLAISAEYLELFEQLDVAPQPMAETATRDEIRWHFHPPPATTLRIQLKTRIEPGVHRGRSGELAVLDGERRVVAASLRTWLAP